MSILYIHIYIYIRTRIHEYVKIDKTVQGQVHNTNIS